LEEAGGKLSDIVTMMVFMVDDRFDLRFLELGKEIFKDNFPASALINIHTPSVFSALATRWPPDATSTSVLLSVFLSSDMGGSFFAGFFAALRMSKKTPKPSLG
jgi:hypothetical protein